MKFSDLENIMESNGVGTLAEIARTLDTTPQAVSNWKARDQVPYHIVTKINNISSPIENEKNQFLKNKSSMIIDENSISLSDILLTMAEQIKVIAVVTFTVVFLTFTYVKFVQPPLYESKSTILLPENKSGLAGLVGFASQFGVNMPQGNQADLSSPSLFPELIDSRIFVERILNKQFFKQQYDDSLSLLAILTHGLDDPTFGIDTLIHQAMSSFQSMVSFDNQGSFSVLTIKSDDPKFARDLNKTVLEELKALNRFFKSQTVKEKTLFIENRIYSVKKDLEDSEQSLKEFNEQNRQIISPSLQLTLDRLTREVEIQKNIFLTLKQQYELAKIEEIQGESVVRVLDQPQIPLGPSNKNLKLSVILSIIIGLGLGIILGFARSYLNNNDIDERRKLRKVKNFLKKKSKDAVLDIRISATISILMALGLPFYLTHKSQNPVFFGLYSNTMMFLNVSYIIILISSISLLLYLKNKK